jgi:anti-anti-sigma regulatory factor
MNKLIRQLRILLGIMPPDADQTDIRRPFTEIWDVDGIVVVRFHDLNAAVMGCDMDKINKLGDELLSIVAKNPLAVILDFENRDFVPVATFKSLLVRLHKRLSGKLSMCNLPGMVAEQFKVTRLDTLIEVYAGLDEALAAVKIPHLELPKFQRIPLVADRLLIGRIPFDEEKHRNVLGIAKEQARCEGEWLYLPDPHVSKRHAILTRTDDSYAIEDAGSRGGTFVNDQVITEKTTLEIGDTIKVGELEIMYGDEITRGLNFLWQRFDCD